MKTSFGILAVLLAFMLSSCGSKDSGYNLEISFEDMPEGMAYLMTYTDRTYELVDSAKVENGKALFTGSTTYPALYGISSFAQSRSPLAFFLENAQMSVNINEGEKTITVNGGTQDALYREAQQAYRADNLNLETLFAEHPNSVVGPYMAIRNYSYLLSSAELGKLLSSLSPDLDGSIYVSQLTDLLRRKLDVEVGQMAPDFTMESNTGEKVSLSDFKGSYVLLDFWATWCPDCRRELPYIKEVYENLKDKGLKVLAVSLDRSRDAWLNGIKNLGLEAYTHVSEILEWKTPLLETYAVRWIPTTFLISPEGRILAVSLDEDGLLENVREVFGMDLQPSEQ